MTTESPTLEQWQQLYQLMIEIKQLSPWQWMYEAEIFGIQSSPDQEPNFISIMGARGEHFAISVYLGLKGLGLFWQMEQAEPRLTQELILQVPQLQASFEDRDILTDKDRQVINRLGLKFRGAHAWPQFRSFRPGFFPWYIENWEAEILIHALEQTLVIAPRFRQNSVIFHQIKRDKYLVRVKQGDTWQDSIQYIPSWTEGPFQVNIDENTLARLKAAMPGDAVFEVDLLMLDTLIKDKLSDRPFFPFVLMLAEQKSGFITTSDLLIPLPSLATMRENIPSVLAMILADSIPPKELYVKDELLFQLLQPLAQEVGLTLKKVSRLRYLDPAQKELRRALSNS
jgi:hypothetical protein